MKRLLIGIALTLGLSACSSADGTDPDTSDTGPAAGYTRFTPEAIDVGPGDDKTYCQWVAAPADKDMDILDITGLQTFPGHHALLYSTPVNEPVGTTRLCTNDDQATMKLLGGVGGEGAASGFPKGAALRIHKGESLLMNTHYLNTSDKRVTGKSMLDAKFVEPSSDHILASFFANLTVKFAIAPHGEATADATSVLPHDVKFISLLNHMHEFGSSVYTEEVANGVATDVQRDKTWQYEWQFNPPQQKWAVDAPHVMKGGETLHTQCTWQNSTAEMMTFPREMCVAAGFIIADKDITCVDGQCKE